MSDEEQMPAPVTGDEEEDLPEGVAVGNATEGFTASEQAVYDSEYNRMVKALAAQPKEWIRLQEDTFVQINGWKWTIAKGRVQVPVQVAEILVEAGRI